MMAAFMPIMAKSDNLPCLVVGGGRIACRKVLKLLRFQAGVTVISVELSHGLHKLWEKKLIQWKRKRFSLWDLLRCGMVVAATNDRHLNRKICIWANRFRVLSNSVDDPDVSGFIFPAVHKTGPLSIAVSTNGYAPAVALRVKRDLGKKYKPGFGVYLQKMRTIREDLKKSEPDYQKRKVLLRKLASLDYEKIQSLNDFELGEWIRHGAK